MLDDLHQIIGVGLRIDRVTFEPFPLTRVDTVPDHLIHRNQAIHVRRVHTPLTCHGEVHQRHQTDLLGHPKLGAHKRHLPVGDNLDAFNGGLHLMRTDRRPGPGLTFSHGSA